MKAAFSTGGERPATHVQWAAARPYLSEAQSVGHDAVHGVGVHLRPLQLEVKDPRPVLPQRVVGVVVELGRVGLSCGGGMEAGGGGGERQRHDELFAKQM